MSLYSVIHSENTFTFAIQVLKLLWNKTKRTEQKTPKTNHKTHKNPNNNKAYELSSQLNSKDCFSFCIFFSGFLLSLFMLEVCQTRQHIYFLILDIMILPVVNKRWSVARNLINWNLGMSPVITLCLFQSKNITIK